MVPGAIAAISDTVMQRAPLNFAEELIEAQDADAIQKAMVAIAAAYGLKLCAYLAMRFEPSGRAYLVSNYPREWTNHYLDQRYERLDPVIGRPALRPSRSSGAFAPVFSP